MSATVAKTTFEKGSLELKFANAFIGLGSLLVIAVILGLTMRHYGSHESLVITVLGIGAAAAIAAMYALMGLVVAVKVKE